MTDLTPRKQLLDPEFADALQMDDYVKNLYHQIISEIPVLPEESNIEKSRRRIGYMNIRMFMQTLLDRMDRTSMYHGLRQEYHLLTSILCSMSLMCHGNTNTETRQRKACSVMPL